ncbi:uncharacterized protein LOC134290520 [Aedes albopictus]|uniref:Integrase catalytic domain-containing protein n=1 Tax=Aedes albopictus TaxID=7160 RepID=A0ABM1XZS2_AEDAL
MESYPDEYVTLHHNRDNPDQQKMLDKSSPLWKQSPYLDNAGVIRMNSRIREAPIIPFHAKFPIILPKDHCITQLVVDNYHRRCLHANNETVLNRIRQRFCIPALRTLIKRTSRKCQRCRISKAVPNPPLMAPLPAVRLASFIRPFTNTGIDYFGPLMVKQGRSTIKRWIVLFTCLSIRAIHLEVAHGLTTQSCVMAIRRFVARRGAPETIFSDNGTNFVGANNLLKEELRTIEEQCAATFTNARTNWLFNPPAAPHMGGAWERLVRSVKTAMTAISDHPHHPSDEGLETIILEVEAMVNSRPLTHVPLDSAEDEALTPNHFLLYGTQGIIQPASLVDESRATLRDSWKLTKNLVDGFWRRWIREYLPDLAKRTKWHQPVRPLEKGDFVIVFDETKRNGWERGRIVQVVKGKDGQVRKATVQTASGVLTRPAVKLALLDVGELTTAEGSGSRNHTGGGMLSNPPCDN